MLCVRRPRAACSLENRYGGIVAKGYAEGSAMEERLADLDRVPRKREEQESPFRSGVFGSTDAEPKLHFLGWADEVDADALFASGEAWGLSTVRRPA